MTIVEALSDERHLDDKGRRQYFLNTPFDSIELEQAAEMIARSDHRGAFRYIVTPNADHVVRLNREPSLRPIYDGAWMTLCDSKPIWLFGRARSRSLCNVTGADLTVRLFKDGIPNGTRVALIVGTEKVAADVRAAYPGIDFRVHVPPMGLLSNLKAQQECMDFAVRSEARFIFLAVGAPQSEIIAHKLSKSPAARGTALCIGAALEFLAGTKKRAPLWMRKLSLEWLYRMISDPKRLWRRYVYGIAPLLALFARDLLSRSPAQRSPQHR